jgi:hypothetical protein
LFHLHEEIERSELVRKIENGVAHQYLVVEVDDVEAHNKIGAEQLVNQIVDPLLRIDPVFVVIGTVSNTERHSHVSLLVPTTYVVRRALRFQIKINNVHSEGRIGRLIKCACVETKQIFKTRQMVFFDDDSVGNVNAHAVCTVRDP